MIQVTDAAKEKMVGILIDAKHTYLRFGLQGGGCNGFTYFFELAENAEEDDFVLDLVDRTEYTVDCKLLVDPMSMMYVDEATIDYKKDLMGESFVFNNPKVSTSCGCGSSVGF